MTSKMATTELFPSQPSARSGQKKGRLPWRAALLVLAATVLAACSALSTGYNNAPTLITWWADSYFDLDGDQEAQLKDRLRNLRAWHRTQLPDYARVFGETQNRLARTVEVSDVAWLFDESEKRLRRLVAQAAPDAADLALSLRRENLVALENKFAKINAEFEKEYISAPLEKRQDKRFERILKEAERWYGDFSSEQQGKMRVMSDLLPANFPLVLEDRKRRQGELLLILNAAVDKTASREEIAGRLNRWATAYEQGRHPAYREYAARYKLETQKMFAAIANLATPEQRETARRNVQQYMEEFKTLAVASN